MEVLSPLEEAVLSKLLSGEDPRLRLLRQQLVRIRVARRQMTGVGFLTELEVPPEAPSAPLPPKVRIGDVIADVDGLQGGLGFVLFIEDGRLALLEGYTYHEDWPEGLERWRLKYDPPNRDLSGLNSADQASS